LHNHRESAHQDIFEDTGRGRADHCVNMLVSAHQTPVTDARDDGAHPILNFMVNADQDTATQGSRDTCDNEEFLSPSCLSVGRAGSHIRGYARTGVSGLWSEMKL